MNTKTKTTKTETDNFNTPAYDFEQLQWDNLEETEERCGETFPIGRIMGLLGYCFFNPNPRGAVVGDCVKRAVVVATGRDYRELEAFMNKNKFDKKRPYNFKENYEHCIKMLGGVKINMNVPAGTSRWHVNTIDEVMKDYPHVNYCIRVSKHLIGVRGGVIYDLFDDRVRDKGIYNIFIFGASESEAAEIQARCSKGSGTKPGRLYL